MNITLNNLEGENNLICFTDIPNILKVSDTTGGTYTSLGLTLFDNLYSATTADTQWTITFMGESISNVLNYDSAVNKSFYVASDNASTAASIARALRNCPKIQTAFRIYQYGDYVSLEAREIGGIGTGDEQLGSNIPSQYLSIGGQDGSAYSQLYGSKIDVDIFQGIDYITTLEKNFYNGEAAFDLSPVLTTFAEYGNAVPFTMTVSAIKNGQYSLLGEIDTNYVSIGYMCNQGSKYLFNEFQVAQNNSRGESREFENNTILYIYKPEIPISIYRGNAGGMLITIDYLNSAGTVLTSTTSTWHNTSSSNVMVDLKYYLDETWFNQAFYVDLTLGNTKLRYNVIKPLKATEHCQRICWRNSYGGISFVDMTGQKTETRNVETSTYQKNIFDYYTDDMNELEIIYNNVVKYSVTLKSHLFENDGKYIFNDLLQSSKVWTEINGQKYAIIIDSVSVDEVENNNDIYEATVKYRYSQQPSLI